MPPNNQSGSSAGIEAALQSIASAIIGSDSVSPDANGWYMKGDGRRYFKRFSGSFGAVMNAHDGVQIVNSPLPVGMSNLSNYMVSQSFMCVNREIACVPFASLSASTFLAHAFNHSATSFTPGFWILDVTLDRI